MQTEETALKGVEILRPKRINDIRGYFQESWSAARLEEAGIKLNFVQENQSFMRSPGTVRGLHVQAPPKAQTRLVRVLTGEVLDVAVDVRRGSPTFGGWVGVTLSAMNGRQLLVPKGFLHGFVTRHPNTTVLVKVTTAFDGKLTQQVDFADSDLGIDWGIAPHRLMASPTDTGMPAFRDWVSPFTYAEAAA
ncbi:MAG: dTDP-4-dehydrorhamnose 3,5-epimerase [Rhodobacteraceae bacterium]|nr:dTDP-4-dehydrorhamnose 3,5-epimerase [Paracoccaceae bacterium]